MAENPFLQKLPRFYKSYTLGWLLKVNHILNFHKVYDERQLQIQHDVLMNVCEDGFVRLK